VLDTIGFDALMRGSAFVVTGEGALDEQTLQGKIVDEVATRCRQGGVTCHAIVGRNRLDPFGERIIDLASVTEATTIDELKRAGADLVDDVTAWEELKLRVLNGMHSTLAYLGALAGRDTIEQALAMAGMREFLRCLLLEDVVPTLQPPPGVDPVRYGEDVLERFTNPMVVHRTLQVAMDGSQKLPQRLVPTIADRLRAGAEPRWAALALAGWMRFVTGRADGGAALPLDDPLAERIRAAVEQARRPGAVAEALLGLGQVFGEELRDSAVLRALVVE